MTCQALVYCVRLNCADCRAALSRGSTDSCCFHKSGNILSSLIDGCLKYKNKEKRKTGPGPRPRLNYDVKIVPKPGPRGVKKKRGPSDPGPNAGLYNKRHFPKYSVLFSHKRPQQGRIRWHTQMNKAFILCKQIDMLS